MHAPGVLLVTSQLEIYNLDSLNFSIHDLKTSIPFLVRGVSIAFCMVCLAVTGCTLIKLKKDVVRSQESTVIIGRVEANFPANGPIIVAACSTGKGKRVAQYTVLHDSGEYELMVDQGEYYVFAYCDNNSNLVYEAGEPAGQHGNPKEVQVPAVGVVFDIDIVIPDKGRHIVIPHGSTISPVKPEKLYSRQAGAITDLDDKRFAEEYGTKGFWEPGTFFKEMGGNIFFLEEYDPEKTPILYIHGAAGTPSGWRYFVDNIDRTRFQPWFFYYPSGGRLSSMSYLLLWKLINLQTKYHFNKIYITAHSMGGLVARSFIVNYGRQFPYVKLFISLATPWGGDRMAEYGVEQSPAVIPSWIDMQPEGDFITSLYRLKMPEHISFYMFSGHRGSRNPFRSNNDGTVALSSLLDHRPQSEAEMNYAFNEDHASIILSKDVLIQYNTILNAFDEKQSASLDRSGGHLKLHFAYNYDFDDVMPRPMLILTPTGKKNAESVTFLNVNDNGRTIGPFPAGEYYASLVTTATAGKPDKQYVPVSIESNKTRALDFIFAPDGVIRACVTVPQKPEDKFVGMPDYMYRSDDRKIDFESITLKGNGIDRILQPMRGEYIDDNDYLISRADFCYNECFGFFGLPAGDYQLTLKAEGYEAIVENMIVTPGVPTYFRGIELTPD